MKKKMGIEKKKATEAEQCSNADERKMSTKIHRLNEK